MRGATQVSVRGAPLSPGNDFAFAAFRVNALRQLLRHSRSRLSAGAVPGPTFTQTRL